MRYNINLQLKNDCPTGFINLQKLSRIVKKFKEKSVEQYHRKVVIGPMNLRQKKTIQRERNLELIMIEWDKLAPWDQERLCVEFSAKFGHSDPCINLVIDGDGDGDLNGTVNITMQKSSVDLTLNEEVSFACF